MQTVFEKIIEKLEEKARFYNSASDVDQNIRSGVIIAKEIVQEEAAEYNNGWIPCSELLPAYGQTVLASVCAEDAEWKIIIACYKEEDFWLDGKIDAWQPLPKPFQKGE